MKTLFLTSSPTGPLDGSRRVTGFDEWNGFRENLKKVWPESARCLMVAAFPDHFRENDEMTAFFAEAVRISGLPLDKMGLLDDRCADSFTAKQLQEYDVIFLAGGHVPTQNAFFQRLGLREWMQEYDGIVIGISAGTMNCADLVYAQPEEPGEAIDPDYHRFLPGLGLTSLNILPHYQMLKDAYLDGMHLYKEIAAGDSMGREFLILSDGSYVLQEETTDDFGNRILQTRVYGETWCLKDGMLLRK